MPEFIKNIPAVIWRENKLKLINCLLNCPTVQDNGARKALIRQLPEDISAVIEHHNNLKIHLYNIVDTCLNYPNGIEYLIAVILDIEENSNPAVSLNEFLISIADPRSVKEDQISELKNFFYNIEILNDEIKKLCYNSLPKPNHLTLPSFSQEKNGWFSLFDWLSSISASEGNVPILNFVAQLFCFVKDTSVKNNIKEWMKEVGSNFNLTQPDIDQLLSKHDCISSRQTLNHLYLQIKMEEIKDELYSIQAWLFIDQENIRTLPFLSEKNSKSVPDLENTLFKLDQMPKIINELLNNIYDRFGVSKKQITIEVFLPLHLLSFQIDHWSPEIYLNGCCCKDDPIGCRYPIVLRSKERFEDKNLLRYLKDCWDKKFLQKNINTCISWIDKPESKGLRSKLDRGEILFALKFVPDIPFFIELLKIGMPFVFWPRQINRNEEDINTFETFLSCKKCHKIEELPQLICQERRRIVDEAISREYITYHLSLLWDDIERPLPTVKQNFTQHTGKL